MMTPWGRGAPVRVAVLLGELRLAGAPGGGGAPLGLRLVRGRKVWEVAQAAPGGAWAPLEFPATLFQRAGGLQPKEYRVEVYSLAGMRPVLLGSGPLDLAQAVTFGLQGRMEGAAPFWRDGSAVPVSVPLAPGPRAAAPPASPADALSLAGILTFRARAGGASVRGAFKLGGALPLRGEDGGSSSPMEGSPRSPSSPGGAGGGAAGGLWGSSFGGGRSRVPSPASRWRQCRRTTTSAWACPPAPTAAGPQGPRPGAAAAPAAPPTIPPPGAAGGGAGRPPPPAGPRAPEPPSSPGPPRGTPRCSR